MFFTLLDNIIIYNIVNVLISMVKKPQDALIIVTAAIILLTVPFIIRIWYNTSKRLKLLRRLKKLQKDGVAEVKYDGCKFVSVFFPSLEFNIQVTRKCDGNQFNCHVVCGGKIGAPMYFREDQFLVEHGFRLAGGGLLSKGGAFGAAVDVTSLGGMENPTNMIFGYKKGYDMAFPEGKGKKIIIINPSPSKVFYMHGDLSLPVDNGMRVFDYSIYTASAFINMVREKYTE